MVWAPNNISPGRDSSLRLKELLSSGLGGPQFFPRNSDFIFLRVLLLLELFFYPAYTAVLSDIAPHFTSHLRFGSFLGSYLV